MANTIDIGVALHGFGLADEAFGVLSGSLERLGEQAKRANQAFSKWDASRTVVDMEALTDASEEAEKAMTDVATTALTLLGTKLNQLSRSLIGAGAELQQMKIAMETLASEGENTSRTLEKLVEVSKLPGLDFQQVLKGVTVLRASGLEASLATEAVEQLGNALASVGGNPQELQGVIRAFSQIQSKGKIYAEEILQIAERLPQIRTIMLETFGTANTEILQAEGFTSQEFIEAIVGGLSRLKRVQDNAVNAMQNFENAMFRLKATIGETMLDSISKLLVVVTETIEAFNNMGDGTKSLIGWVIGITGVVATASAGFLALRKAIGALSIMQTVAQLQIANSTLNATSVALRATALSAGALKLALWGIGIGAVAGGLFLAYKWWRKSNEEIKKQVVYTNDLKGKLDEIRDLTVSLEQRQMIVSSIDSEINRLETINSLLRDAEGSEKNRLDLMKEQSELKLHQMIQKYNVASIGAGHQARFVPGEDGKESKLQRRRIGSDKWEDVDRQEFGDMAKNKQIEVIKNKIKETETQYTEDMANAVAGTTTFRENMKELTTSFSTFSDNALDGATAVLQFGNEIKGLDYYKEGKGKEVKATKALESYESRSKVIYDTIFGDLDRISFLVESISGSDSDDMNKMGKTPLNMEKSLREAMKVGNDPKALRELRETALQKQLRWVFDIDQFGKGGVLKIGDEYNKTLRGRIEKVKLTPTNLDDATMLYDRIIKARTQFLTAFDKDGKSDLISQDQKNNILEFLNAIQGRAEDARARYIIASRAKLDQTAEHLTELEVWHKRLEELQGEKEEIVLFGQLAKNKIERYKNMKNILATDANMQRALGDILKTGETSIKGIDKEYVTVFMALNKAIQENPEQWKDLMNMDSGKIYKSFEEKISTGWDQIIDGISAQWTTLAQLVADGGKNVVEKFLFTGDDFNLEAGMGDLVTMLNELSKIFPESKGRVDIGSAIKNVKQIDADTLSTILGLDLFSGAGGREKLADMFKGIRASQLAKIKISVDKLNIDAQNFVALNLKLADEFNKLIGESATKAFEDTIGGMNQANKLMNNLYLDFEGNLSQDLLTLDESVGTKIPTLLDEIAKKFSGVTADGSKSSFANLKDLIDFAKLEPDKEGFGRLYELSDIDLRNFITQIDELILKHDTWEQRINVLKQRYSELRSDQAQQRDMVLSEATGSALGMHFIDGKLISKQEMENKTKTLAIDKQISQQLVAQSNLQLQMAKLDKVINKQRHKATTEQAGKQLTVDSYGIEAIKEQTQDLGFGKDKDFENIIETGEVIEEMKKSLPHSVTSMKKLKQIVEGGILNVTEAKEYFTGLKDSEKHAKTLSALTNLYAVHQHAIAKSQLDHVVSMMDNLAVAKELSLISIEDLNNKEQQLQTIKNNIFLLENNNKILEKKLDLETESTEKMTLQKDLDNNRRNILKNQIQMKRDELEFMNKLNSKSKKDLENMKEKGNFNEAQKVIIETLIKQMDAENVKSMQSLEKQKGGYQDLQNEINGLINDLKIMNLESIKALESITDDEIKEFFDDLSSSISVVNSVLDQTASIAEDTKKGINFLAEGMGDLVNSKAKEILAGINSGVLGQLDATNKMVQVLKKREVSREEFGKKEEVYLEQRRSIAEILSEIKDKESLEEAYYEQEQERVNGLIHENQRERIKNEIEYNDKLRRLYNEDLKRNNDRINDEYEFNATLSDIEKTRDAQRFEEGWKGSKKGKDYEDAKKEHQLRSENEWLDRNYKIRMDQFKLRKNELGMTGNERIWDSGLTPEKAKVLQEEVVFVQKHELEKTKIQQEADNHNMDIQKKRRAGNINFQLKYQNAIADSWRKNKQLLFSIEQEYQDKMKGMYDSEGKILKDKKEQHDKLQTEEAELRKKTNQNYLKEQGTLYAQLVKDKTSAEKRAEKGRSIDPFSPDPNDVKDSIEKINSDRRRIINKTFSLNQYQQGKAFDEEQESLLKHFDNLEEKKKNFRTKDAWWETEKSWENKRDALYTEEEQQMHNRLRMRKKYADMTTADVGVSSTPGKGISTWERNLMDTLREDIGENFTNITEKSLEKYFTEQNTSEKRGDIIERLFSKGGNLEKGLEALITIANSEMGIKGVEDTYDKPKTLSDVVDEIKNGSRNIVSALNAFGRQAIPGFKDYNYVDIRGENASMTILNGKSTLTSNSNIDPGVSTTSGLQEVGLVKIEINDAEFPVFGRLSVKGINSASAEAGFIPIVREAIQKPAGNGNRGKNLQ